jgi:hypothetical protein
LLPVVVAVVVMLVIRMASAALVVVTVQAAIVAAVVEVAVAHKLPVERAVSCRVLPAPTAAQVHLIKAERPELVTTRLVVAVMDITVVAVELVMGLFRLSAPMVVVVVQGI